VASKVEFLLTAVAFIMVIILPTSQLIIGQISSLEHWNNIQKMEKEAELLANEILNSPGEPLNWGLTQLTSFPDKFGLAKENSKLLLDTNKVARLDARNPYYLPYDAADQNGLLISPIQGNLKNVLDLENMDIQISILPYFNLTLKEDISRVVFKTTDWSNAPLSQVNISLLAINETNDVILQTSLLTNEFGEAALPLSNLTGKGNTILLFAIARLGDNVFSYNYMYVVFTPQTFDNDMLRVSILESQDPGHLNVTVYVNGVPSWFNATIFYLDKSGSFVFSFLDSASFSEGPSGWYRCSWSEILVPSNLPVFLAVNVLRSDGTRGTGFYSLPSIIGFYSNKESVTKDPLPYGEIRENARNIIVISKFVVIRRNMFLVVVKCYY